jgi:hypothetical protein
VAAAERVARQFPCALCGRVFHLQWHLDRHRDLIHNTRAPERAASAAAAIQLPCALCGIVFHLQWQLNQHGLTHMGLIHNTSAPERAVIQKPTTYNEHEEPSSIEAEENYFDMIVEYVSQAAQHYPAVKETVNEELSKKSPEPQRDSLYGLCR